MGQAAPVIREIELGELLVDEYKTPRGPIRIQLPRYVRACRKNEWRLHLWEPGSAVAKCVPYRCRSWRCAGACRSWRAKFDMRRILDALRPAEPEDVCFFVLTLDRKGTMGGRPWPTRYHAYMGLSACTRVLLKRLNRALLAAQHDYHEACAAVLRQAVASSWCPLELAAEHAKLGPYPPGVRAQRRHCLAAYVLLDQAISLGWAADRLRAIRDTLGPYPATIQNRWVGTCEQHRSGWPHYNLIVVSPYLARRLSDGYEERRAAGLNHEDARLVQGLLKRHIVESGFGERSTGEAARNKGDVAWYIVKAASVMEAAVPEEIATYLPGEVAKMSQVPEAAPKGFRRIRSGVRFLPAKRKSGFTGILLDREGNALGGAQDPIEQLVGLLGPLLGKRPLPHHDGVILDPHDGVLTDYAHASPELPGVAARSYKLRPYDPADPRQQARPSMLIPDPTGSTYTFLKFGHRRVRVKCRVEPKSIMVIDFTNDTS